MEPIRDTGPRYRDASAAISDRVADLLRRMSLDEKVGQLSHDAPANSRLGIPAMRYGECLHGFMLREATPQDFRPTVFPQAIALGSTWNPDLVEEVATIAAREARALGFHNCYSPVLDVARDPRYGRTEECYGEDPYLVARLGIAFINGLQGRGQERLDSNHVIATAKHFAAYGNPARGINGGWLDTSERCLWEIHLPPFRAAVRDARVESVMPAHTDINGVPCHASSWLLQTLLRETWGFEGFVVADNRDVGRLHDMHRVADSYLQAAAIAFNAGVDQELVLEKADVRCYPQYLAGAVSEGLVSDERIDQAVGGVLRAKFMLGLFDEQPDRDPGDVFSAPDRREVALRAAHEAIVLLKNEGGLLPLQKGDLASIAVIGPNAADTPLGGYTSPVRDRVVSILDGLTAKVGRDVEVLYAAGCPLLEDSTEGFREAVDAASRSDVAILCVGGSEKTCREGIDRDDIGLIGRQQGLVEAVVATGTPTVVVLVNGRPLTISWIAENVPAIVEAWYLGCETGNAVADVIFGDYNPGGKLTVSFPRSLGHLPASYQQRAYFTGSGKGEYLLSDRSPLFPFGYGRSYTTFTYEEPTVSPTVIPKTGEARVAVGVTNVGDRAGEEVVQMYVRDDYSSFARYDQELKGFARVSLEPGETKVVTFSVGADELGTLDAEFKPVVEPGTFTLRLGTSSVDYREVVLRVEG